MNQSELKKLLHYDPLTGNFTRLTTIKHNSHIEVGSVAGWTCKKHGYHFIRLNGVIYRAHRLAVLYMTGEFPDHDVDHHDHDRANNKWLNLSEATHSMNMKNLSLRNDNTSGAMGVTFNKSRGNWRARISVNGKRIHLGYFKTFNDAVTSKNIAEIKYGYHKNHGIDI